MPGIDRTFEDVSVKPLIKGRLELRIRGAGKNGNGDRWTMLSASEARVIAYELLSQAERLGRPK